MWANPRAAPPPRTKPILIGRGDLGSAGVDADGDKTPGCAVVDDSGAVVWHATKAMQMATSCKDNRGMDFINNALLWADERV